MKIDFTIDGFSDALFLPDDHDLSDAEIESMKKSRYANWRAALVPVADDTNSGE